MGRFQGRGGGSLGPGGRGHGHPARGRHVLLLKRCCPGKRYEGTDAEKLVVLHTAHHGGELEDRWLYTRGLLLPAAALGGDER